MHKMKTILKRHIIYYYYYIYILCAMVLKGEGEDIHLIIDRNRNIKIFIGMNFLKFFEKDLGHTP